MAMKTTTQKKQRDDNMVTSDGTDLDDLSLAEAARITGYTYQWLLQLSKDGFYPRKPDGRVSLPDVIRGIERSITGWKPPGYEGGYRR